MAVRVDLQCPFATAQAILFTPPSPVNITGWNLRFTVQLKSNPANALLTKTSGSGITVNDAANGLFTVNVSATDTGTTLEARQYEYTVTRTDAGFEDLLAYGLFTVFELRPL